MSDQPQLPVLRPSPTGFLLRLNGGVIAGVAAGISGFLVVMTVLVFLWYRRRRKESGVRPHDVLQAEFTSDHDDADPADSSAHLTPFLSSTITRYRAVSPLAPISLPSTGCDIPPRDGPSLYQSPFPGPPPGSRFPGAGEEKRRAAAAMRKRDQQMRSEKQDLGSMAIVSGDSDDAMPPDYYLVNHSSTSEGH